MTPLPGLEFISPSKVTQGSKRYEFHLMNEETASKHVKLESYRIVCSETLPVLLIPKSTAVKAKDIQEQVQC